MTKVEDIDLAAVSEEEFIAKAVELIGEIKEIEIVLTLPCHTTKAVHRHNALCAVECLPRPTSNICAIVKH